MDSIDAVSVAKFLSAPTAFLLCGYSLSATQMTLPLLYNQPASVSSTLLGGIYTRGAAFIMPGVIIATTASSYLAYTHPKQRKLFATSAALNLSVPLFTFLVMTKGIYRLIEISQSSAQAAKAEVSGEAVELLKQWALQNALRAAIYFVAGTLSWVAVAQIAARKEKSV